MSAYALTPRAKADIFDIWSHVAIDSEDAANRVEEAIYDACMFVAEAPLRGHTRPVRSVSGREPAIPATPWLLVADKPSSGRGRSAWQTRYASRLKAAALIFGSCPFL